MEARIAVCILTHNRYEVFRDTLYNHGKYRPDNSMLIVVDDASDKPVRIGGTFYRFEKNVGVAKATNKALEMAYERGAEHIFVFNDDCYPIKDNWWIPYVEHPEPHLMYQFKLPNKPPSDMQELYRDDKTVAYSHTRGAMIYIERRVLKVVGGFDEAYGLYGYEHPDFTNRIHNAGLTTHRAMDVPNSHELFYCLDQDGKIEPSIPDKDRQASMRKNHLYYRANRGSKEWKPYK